MILSKTFSKETLKAFLSDFKDNSKNKLPSQRQIDIQNIPEDFIELIIGGLSVKTKKNIIWINKENADLVKFKIKLEKWLDLFSIQINVITYTIPFSDPYISNQINNNFYIEKNDLIKAVNDRRQTIIITTLAALNIKCEDPVNGSDLFINISIGDKIDRDLLLSELVLSGYKFEPFVENIGEMAKRGGVVDIFPPGFEEPVRIELFGNEVSGITVFNLESRASIGAIKSCSIPSGDIFNNTKYSDYYFKNDLKYISDILPDNKIIVSDINKVMSEFSGLLQNYKRLFSLTEKEELLPDPKDIFALNLYKTGFLNIPFLFDNIRGETEFKKLKNNLNNFNQKDINELKYKNKENLFIFSNDAKLIKKLREEGLVFSLIESTIPFSFENTSTETLFLTEKEIIFKRGIAARSLVKKEDISNSIKIGEFIVHEKHGIGIFSGFFMLATGQVGKNEQEFLKIEFANKDILYVPTYDADVLTKYSLFEGTPPKLDKIGGKTWSLKKSRAKSSILVFAQELLDIYALRKSIKGHSYSGDPELENKLQYSFPYIETPDQEKAIKEVLSDMSKAYPMERLVCGDVSFGKTEVAIRAAFRVVLEGKQVAILCPTTILSEQHHKTFTERLKDFPLKIEKLSRMVPAKKRKQISDEVKTGKIDILIGTHAIISKSIEFKNLGLFVVDEEQRFGVFQKEKMKKNRENVDVLILSATPIPRTLSMSFAGLADISTIATPPPGRMSIKNYIGRYSKKIIISAVLNEIERGGSVFIVYNSINKLYSFKEELSGWLDNISIAVIHAKMRTTEIDKNLSDFIEGKHHILLSTTIIENGIDINNVNTMIVIDADNFGLTQLYQLRGRIGRGKRQAYAYFLIKKENLTEKAQLRLEGIREFSSIGSGFKLAEYDLKLRGAGALLGNKQHGHIEALGFEYYNNMLKRTIEELKGEKHKDWEGKININFNYAIDKGYIENSLERMKFYSEIAEAQSFSDIDRIKTNISNIYGSPGKEIEKIFFIGKVKLLSKQFNCERVDISTTNIVFKFSDLDLTKIRFSQDFIESYTPVVKEDKTLSFSFINYDTFLNELKENLSIETEKTN